jgi:hypothetical protein
MNKCVLSAIIFFILNSCEAQSIFFPRPDTSGYRVVRRGNQFLQVGITTPNSLSTFLDIGGLGSLLNGTQKTGVGPIHLDYEYMVNNITGIGASITYSKATETYNLNNLPFIGGQGYVSGKVSLWQFALTASRHMFINNKFDAYAIGAAGINIWKGSYTVEKLNVPAKNFTAPTPFGYNGLLGIRYFTNNNFAFYAQAGMGTIKLHGTLGVCFKLIKK